MKEILAIERANAKNLLELANRLINDDEPTIAMFTNPKDEVFELPLNS